MNGKTNTQRKNDMRTPEQILAKLETLKGQGEFGDMFGVIAQTLLEQLPYEHALPFLREGVTEQEWTDVTRGELGTIDPVKQAHAYMTFAASKIVGERGLSCTRNIDHMYAWVWLHGTDEDADALMLSDYGWYGRGQMMVAARLLGLSKEWDEILTSAEGD
jgi:hypothetical protein